MGLLQEVYRWVFVPRSVWPVDVKGLCEHLLGCLEEGKKVDRKTRLLCSFLGELPAEEVCRRIAEHEQAVKAGSYESLINAQFKFDSMEKELSGNPEFRADWERIKAHFPMDEIWKRSSVIRPRMVQERNFRPREWDFSWQTEKERFRNVFDAFCHKWNLYGMERRKIANSNIQHPEKNEILKSEAEALEERPLLLKLSVNLTAFGTMIEVPRYWSFDPKRDVKWGAVTKLHRMREVKRQGPKLSAGMAARREEAMRGRLLWREATKAGLKGDRRNQWVMRELGWDERTDESRLRRLLAVRSEED